MATLHSSAELRAAAQQAVTLALGSWCPKMRKDLLDAADRLITEADAREAPGNEEGIRRNFRQHQSGRQ